jgi:hypothetical protein
MQILFYSLGMLIWAGLVTSYGLDDQEIGVRLPTEEKYYFSFLCIIEIGSGTC